jgi:hypothetical protein
MPIPEKKSRSTTFRSDIAMSLRRYSSISACADS